MFDSQDDGDDQEDVDEDIANAEAEAFLDESLIDDEDDEEFADPEEGDEFSDLGEDDEFADPEEGDEFSDLDEDDEFADLEADDETDDDGGDLSFDELKSQYDSGDADWEDETSVRIQPTLVPKLDAESDSNWTSRTTHSTTCRRTTSRTTHWLRTIPWRNPMPTVTTSRPTTPASRRTIPCQRTLAERPSTTPTHPEPSLPDPPWDDGGRPYLGSIPSAYDTEFVVMDWLDYLVDEVGLNRAARTIRFYGSIRWIDPSVESYLLTTLNGFEDGLTSTIPSRVPHSASTTNEVSGGSTGSRRPRKTCPIRSVAGRRGRYGRPA